MIYTLDILYVSMLLIFRYIESYLVRRTRCFTSRAAPAAGYARSQRRKQNAKEKDREAHECRCKLTTCNNQELNAI